MSTEPFIVTGNNKSLLPLKSYVPKRKESNQEILKKRAVYWDTQPSYSGRIEIWQTLRLACEADAIETSQAILDSANITCPTGRFIDGCYDELGNMYMIPDYCLGPLEFVFERKETEIEIESEMDDIDPSLLFDIICRLSTGTDVSIQVAPSFTIKKLLQIVAQKENWDDDMTNSSIVILLGKRYDHTTRISDTPIDGSALVQIMVISK